jgi:hypothetical protein
MIHSLDPAIVGLNKGRRISFSVCVNSKNINYGIISGLSNYGRIKTSSKGYELYRLKKIG